MPGFLLRCLLPYHLSFLPKQGGKIKKKTDEEKGFFMMVWKWCAIG